MAPLSPEMTPMEYQLKSSCPDTRVTLQKLDETTADDRCSEMASAEFPNVLNFEEEVEQPATESAAFADVDFSQVFEENHLECGCDDKH